MSARNPLARGYAIAAILGVMIGGLEVALATKAIPRILAQTMALFMQKMMAQGQAKGCSPSEI